MNLIKKSICLVGLVGLLVSCSADPVSEINETANLASNIHFENDNAFALDVLDIVNEHRASLGLEDLELHVLSETKAVEHTFYMVEENKISHDNFFKRSDFLKDKGAEAVSENVAYGQRTPEAVVQAWLNSPSHKEAIESDYTHTGIGVVANEHGINYYTQIFIK